MNQRSIVEIMVFGFFILSIVSTIVLTWKVNEVILSGEVVGNVSLTINQVCGNDVCGANEDCPADASYCTDNTCYEPTCSNGCGQSVVVSGDTDEGCFDETGCTGGDCQCDGSGNCRSGPDSGESGGGGGPSGGGRAIREIPIDYDLSQEDSAIVVGSLGSIKIFSFDGEVRHLIEFKDIGDDYVDLIFTSSYVKYVTIYLHEHEDIDLNNDGTYDVRAILDSTTNGVAHLTLNKLPGAKRVKDGIPEAIEEKEPKIEFPEPPIVSEEISTLKMIAVLTLIVGFILVVLKIESIYKNRKMHKRRKRKK